MEQVRKNKRILIATGIFPPDIGGPATYAESLIPELYRLGYEIAVVSYGNARIKNYEFRIKDQGQIIVNNIFRGQNIIVRYVKYFLAVWKLAGSADVIYALDIMSAGLPAVLAAKLRGKKAVFRTGGDFLWEKAVQSRWTGQPLRIFYAQALNRRERSLLALCRLILKGFDAVIFSSRLQADIYRDHYGLPESKIHHINNAFVVANEAAPLVSPEEFGRAIIFAGRLIKLKNLRRLLKVFEILSFDKDIKLYIFGSGPDKESLTELIDNLFLSDKVLIKDPIPKNDLLSAIRACLYVVIPSLSDISPNLALECIALGKAVILTRENGLERDISNHALTIDPLNEDDLQSKMEYLLDDNNRRQFEANLKDLDLPWRGWDVVAREHLDIFENKL